MSAYLRLAGVNKTFGSFTALGHIDLEVEKGEFVTFLGPSGSGKTTTLMVIAGFEQATKGEITVADQSLAHLAPQERNIGIVFQNYALFPHKTAAENVYFPLQMRKVGKKQGIRKAEEMLELVGLAGFAHRLPKELSGGQQQRVALARALVFEPDLLLLDEPLGALDKNLREQMQIEIKRIQKRLGVTTIFVTHDQTEAMSMSDRIVVFSNGAIEQAAAPLDIYHRPATRFVADFIGESNLLEATVTDAASGKAQSPVLGEVTCGAEGLPPLTDDQAVTLLIRPEHLKLSREPKEGRQNAQMVIETIVNYGDNAVVIGHVGDQQIRVRVPGADVVILKEGDSCHFSWTADAVFVLDK
ncbi:Spermidine/putrescine import ATP-binding protein PotA [Pseudooceanicola marinus]|uniref:Spermidine/putrescine import ATP-binding protein PotA n=1 Tax=Pseudooceanicola marinus TaxID=396013 RepID=A0A1X7ABK1_9RHOB|nr:ABC transporter ATP-binding protein [Pseudooceanicola marinus]PJE26538.1 ABC transporter ATP-binding protein [Pseudooceanicola marinus]SLN73571.1 Spermidine/putrescine import ATP-binding protein PotA [Pseudooceanicola marinus]